MKRTTLDDKTEKVGITLPLVLVKYTNVFKLFHTHFKCRVTPNVVTKYCLVLIFFFTKPASTKPDMLAEDCLRVNFNFSLRARLSVFCSAATIVLKRDRVLSLPTFKRIFATELVNTHNPTRFQRY